MLAAGDRTAIHDCALRLAERCRLRPRKGHIIVARIPHRWTESGLGVLVATHRRQRRSHLGFVVAVPDPDDRCGYATGDLLIYARLCAQELCYDRVDEVRLVSVRMERLEAVVSQAAGIEIL